MKISLALLLTVVSLAVAAPKPSCSNCGYKTGLSAPGSSSYYTSSYPSYAQSASYYEPAPVYEETGPSVVHETVAAPVVTYRQPHVINTYTTKTVGVPEYIPVKTTIHKTSHEKYHVKVPYEYNYEVERPVVHSTSYINYKPSIRNHVVTVPQTNVVSAPTTSYYAPSTNYVSAPSSSYYAPSTSYASASSSNYYAPSSSYYTPSTSYASASSSNYYAPSSSYYAPSTSYVSAPSSSYYEPSTSYVSEPSTTVVHSGSPSTHVVSAPSTTVVSHVPSSTIVSSPNDLMSYSSPTSSYYSKDYTNSNSYEHLHEDYGNQSW